MPILIPFIISISILLNVVSAAGNTKLIRKYNFFKEFYSVQNISMFSNTLANLMIKMQCIECSNMFVNTWKITLNITTLLSKLRCI